MFTLFVMYYIVIGVRSILSHTADILHSFFM